MTHTHRMLIRIIAITLSVASTLSAQSVRLPSAAQLFVLQGGDTPNVNHHMTVLSQAYGVDFAVTGGSSGRDVARAPTSRVEDFYCWNTPVLAPAAGRVLAMVDSLPDNALGRKDSLRPPGNHVVVQQGDRFMYIAHLRQGTVTVRSGDSVTVGQEIGRCGNSGNTDFPHIHLHATHSAKFGDGVGINLIYGPMRVNLAGKVFERVEWPLLSGLWVQTR